MIPRYTRPEMARIWEPENRFAIWYEIEALACEAQAELGVIPKRAARAVRKAGKMKMKWITDAAKIDAIERVTRHDVIAFLTNLAKAVGPEARFVHQGMTSSDVIDTCLSVQMVQAADLLITDIDALLEAIGNARATDAVLLHGCCHNPTGVDYTQEQWGRIADAFVESGVLPILDVAYHGLGQGLDEDIAGVRQVLAKVPEALVAYSCDKNFGLYRDRVGAFYMIARSAADLPAIVSNANALARANWSMPPDHGGAAVRTVLRDEELTSQWLDELGEMRARMRRVRERLAAADNEVPSLNLAALGHQNGLFAMLPLSREQIAQLREEHGIYMAGSGRINVAGLHEGNTPRFIAALADVTSA